MHYLIYLPNRVGRNSEGLRAAGLDGLLRDDEPGPKIADLTGVGPDGEVGQLFVWEGSTLSYSPESQKWIPAPACKKRNLEAGRYWIGLFNDSPVRPSDLQWNKTIHGLNLELGDKQRWKIPNIANLPHRYAYNDFGEIENLPTADYQCIFDRMMWAYKQMAEHYANDKEFNMVESYEYCCEMLALNYRLTPEIAGILNLMDDASIPTILSSTTDAISIMALQEAAKKKI